MSFIRAFQISRRRSPKPRGPKTLNPETQYHIHVVVAGVVVTKALSFLNSLVADFGLLVVLAEFYDDHFSYDHLYVVPRNPKILIHKTLNPKP